MAELTRESRLTAEPHNAARPVQAPPPLAIRIAWTFVTLAILVGIIGGIYRAWNGRPDWGDLHAEVNYVWTHGHTAPGTAMFGYLPATTFMLWPFMVWLPTALGAVLYVISNAAAAIGSVVLLRRYWLQGPANDTSIANSIVWPVLLAAANLAHGIQSNQTTLWTLFLCVAGITLVARRRDFRGGLLLGIAAAFKTMPLLFALFLLLRRNWAGVAGMFVAFILIDIIPSILFFGANGAVAEHRAWIRRASWHANHHLIQQPELRVHRHGNNAAYAAVLTRWLRPFPDAQRQVILYGNPPEHVVNRYHANLADDEILTFDPMPPRDAQWKEKRVSLLWVPRFHIANWSPNAVWWLWATTLGGAFVLLCAATWRTAGSRHPPETQAAAAVWMLAMFWPSPMMRHYYLAWALPALVIVWQTLLATRQPAATRHRSGRTLAIGACTVWGIGAACLGWRVVRWYGIHLAALAFLTAAAAWAWDLTHRRATRAQSDPHAATTKTPPATSQEHPA